MNTYVFFIRNTDTNKLRTETLLATTWQSARGQIQLQKNEILVG